MYCPKCGKQNQDDAVFCNACGIKIGTQDSAQAPERNDQAFTPMPSVVLNSMPPNTVNPANIVMFKVENTSIIAKMAGEWGDKTFSYIDPQVMYADCTKLFVALQEITQNRVMQFNAEGGPVVPLYRIKKAHPNDWWGPIRIEIDFEGAGGEWFSYANKSVRDADHMALMNLMFGAQQQ